MDFVFDTNTLVSAVLPGGTYYHIESVFKYI